MEEANVFVAVTALAVWAMVGLATHGARAIDDGHDHAGSVAAGVLWPIYLLYRLFLIMWSGKP